MARITTLVCDFDGKTKFESGKGGVEGYVFTVNDVPYQIDLSDRGKVALEAAQDEANAVMEEARKRAAEVMARFVDKAHELTDADKAYQARAFNQRIKNWAYKDDKRPQPPRQGKIPEAVIAAYEEDTGDLRPGWMRK